MKLLQIDTSILGEQSVSRQLTSSVIRQLSTAYPDAEIIHHDFALEPIPHLSDAEFLAWQGVEPNNETANNVLQETPNIWMSSYRQISL